MLTALPRSRRRALAALALASAPLLALAACGGGDDDVGLANQDAGGDATHPGDSSTTGNDATTLDSGTDSAPLEAAPPADTGTDGDAGDAADAAQNFDGGPYLVFFGQTFAGTSEGPAGFHLYDEGTLAPAGDFPVAPAADQVLDVTRDPAATTWWTTARLGGGASAQAAYAVRTGVLSSGPTLLAPADAGLSQTSFAFAVGAGAETFFGSAGVLSSVSSGGAVTPIALPDPSLTVNFLAYDGTVGLVAGTSPFVVDGGTAEPYVLVLAPGSSTLTVAPSSWTTTYAGDGGADAGDAGDGGDGDDGGDADLDAADGDGGDVDAADAALDAGDAGDAGDADAAEIEAGPGGGGPPSFAGITALTLAPGGHLVYGIVSSGLAIVDLTADTGTVVVPDMGIVPAAGAIPVVTSDGAHVVFAADTPSFTRVLLVYDTASGLFSSIADTSGYSFSSDLAIAGDGMRVFAVELANTPGAASNLVRIDPIGHAIAQTGSLALDERASLNARFFTAQ
jgi:hypothetical protein